MFRDYDLPASDNKLSEAVRVLAAEKAAEIDSESGCGHSAREIRIGVALPFPWWEGDVTYPDLFECGCWAARSYVRDCLRFGVTP